MRFTKNQKIAMGAVGSLMVIIILGIVYAAFTQQLTINGSATGRSSSWRVYFSSLSNVSLTGTAKELTAPTIDDNNQTSIGNYSVSVTTPGDTVEYTFDVTNSGDYDATLTGLTKNNPSCTGTGDNAGTDATNVCGKLTYTLKYADGTTVTQNDTLKSKETKTMKLKLTYEEFNDASLLPKADVTITGLGITLTYTQDGNAKVNEDGTTPYVKQYAVGDRITVANETYYVIADSGVNQDYVTALKSIPLKSQTIANYYDDFSNLDYIDGSSENVEGDYTDYPNHSAIQVHYGSNSTYGTSTIKSIIDQWSAAKFVNDELKIVNGYSARLITLDELTTNLGYEYHTFGTSSSWDRTESTPSWVYDYSYWTMTENYDEVWSVSIYDKLNNFHLSNYDHVRPVINVYKSKISS